MDAQLVTKFINEMSFNDIDIIAKCFVKLYPHSYIKFAIEFGVSKTSFPRFLRGKEVGVASSLSAMRKFLTLCVTSKDEALREGSIMYVASLLCGDEFTGEIPKYKPATASAFSIEIVNRLPVDGIKAIVLIDGDQVRTFHHPYGENVLVIGVISEVVFPLQGVYINITSKANLSNSTDFVIAMILSIYLARNDVPYYILSTDKFASVVVQNMGRQGRMVSWHDSLYMHMLLDLDLPCSEEDAKLRMLVREILDVYGTYHLGEYLALETIGKTKFSKQEMLRVLRGGTKANQWCDIPMLNDVKKGIVGKKIGEANIDTDVLEYFMVRDAEELMKLPGICSYLNIAISGDRIVSDLPMMVRGVMVTEDKIREMTRMKLLKEGRTNDMVCKKYGCSESGMRMWIGGSITLEAAGYQVKQALLLYLNE